MMAEDPIISSEEPRKLFPVTSSILDAAALGDRVLSEYGLAEPVDCRFVSHAVNDVYRVRSEAATHFLRVAPAGWRSREEIESEVVLIERLQARGVSVAGVERRSDGSAITNLDAPEGERLAVLFAEAPGRDERNIDLAQSLAYGRLAAGLHDAADTIGEAVNRPVIDETQLLDEPLEALRIRFADQSEELGYLGEIAGRVRQKLVGLPRSAPLFGLCHGDLHPANVRFTADGTPTAFDFDFSGYGWRVYDLSVFYWNSFFERRTSRWRSSRWRAFLAGYEESRPLPAGAIEALPHFFVARQVWLMSLDCQNRGGWPVQWIDERYQDEMIEPIRKWESEFAELKG